MISMLKLGRTCVETARCKMTQGSGHSDRLTPVQSANLCQDLNVPIGRAVGTGLRGTELVDLIEWQMRMERDAQ